SAERKYPEGARFKPRKTHTDEMLDCLRGSLTLECPAQMWLDTREDAKDIGPKRSGKSTIAHVIGRLVGHAAYVGLSLNDWLATPKAAQVLIGKRVGVFADVRLKQGRAYGQNYDPGGADHRSSELLLKITGRDKVSIVDWRE